MLFYHDIYQGKKVKDVTQNGMNITSKRFV